MKRLGVILTLLTVWALLPGEGQAMVRYNTATVQTITGQVTAVERVRLRRSHRVRLLVATPQGVIPVSLGPGRYVKQQNFVFGTGDQVTVIGSRVLTRKRVPVILASEVQKGGQVLKLRDASGAPLWVVKRRY
ncbi:MAG: DNA-binding protein [Deltaproteobacteria bacterium]|nr:DNA-binding protein [Deltaproteobacteria bacterium]